MKDIERKALAEVVMALARLGDAMLMADRDGDELPTSILESTKAAPPKAAKKVKEAEPVADPEVKKAAVLAAIEKPKTPAVSYDDVRAALIDLINARGKETATELLKSFGASNAKTIPEDRFVEFLDAVQKTKVPPPLPEAVEDELDSLLGE